MKILALFFLVIHSVCSFAYALEENMNYNIPQATDYNNLKIAIGVFVVISIVIGLRYLTLQRDNKKLHTLINSAIEGIIVLKNGKFIDGNEQMLKTFGYKYLQELQGFSIYDFVQTNDHKLLTKSLEDDHKIDELKMVKSDGTIFYALVRTTNIEGDKLVLSVIDITELKQMQSKLEEMNSNLEKKVSDEIEKNKMQQRMLMQQSRLAQMGEVISMIAHQWRQPLNNIFSMIQTIWLKHENDKLDKELMTQFKFDTSIQVKYLSDTIDEFREFFRPEKDKEVFHVREVIEHSASLFKPVIEETDIEFNVKYNSDLKMYGFPNELGQVVLNLLNNSFDALIQNRWKEKMWIELAISHTDKEVLITVSDNGGGIPLDIMYKVFDPYFSTKADKNGTGLGMYMSKIIIEDHMGGTIKLQNNDDGLVVTVALELYDEKVTV